MNNVMIRRFFKIVLALLLLSPAAAWTQQRPNAASRPDPVQVFAELIKPYRNLSDYTVKIRAKVLMPTIRIPDFSATLYFKRPDRFHIETKSFAPIPRNSGVFNPLQFDPEKNRITYQKERELWARRGRICTVWNRSTPKARSGITMSGSGAFPSGSSRWSTSPSSGTKGLVKISHRTVSQGPRPGCCRKTSASISPFPRRRHPFDGSSFNTSDNPISGGMRRLDEVSGEGDIEISYSDWKVNTGLAESLFKNDRNR